MISKRSARKACLILALTTGLMFGGTIDKLRVGDFVVTLGGGALADDDGDDGGGSGRGGWDGGDDGRRTSPGVNIRNLFRKFERNTRPPEQRQRPRRAPARSEPAPDFAARELVALGVDEIVLRRLNDAGFVTLEQSRLGTLNTEVARLRIPRRLSLDQARSDVLAIAPDALVDRNHYYQPNAAQGCLSRDCPARELIGWTPAASGPVCSGRPRIGMIDTGVNDKHAAFEGANIEVVRLSREGAAPSANQHGTAVAALLVGARDGRAPGLVPGAELVAVDTFHKAGSGTDLADVYSLVRGLDLLAARRLPVINMSLAGPANALLERAVEHVAGSGTVLVAAAGNDGHRAAPVYPAAYADVVAVTAVDRQKRVYRRAGQGEHIDLAAPGVDVWTAASVSGARTKTGTSFAAPFVTAAIALAAQTNTGENTSRQAAVDLLAGRAEDLGEPGRDPVFGWGLLNPTELCRT